MTEIDKLHLKLERSALLIGSTVGQLSELLNNIKTMTNDSIYKSLLDITSAASLHIHELYYKD